MDAKVIWRGGLCFDGKAASDYIVSLVSSANLEDESGVTPMQMIAIGLAGCTAMDVISILTKKKQEVTDFEVRVHAERAEDFPKVFTSAVLDYIITGHAINELSVLRAIELSVTRYCPAHAMLSKAMPIEMRYQIFEEVGDGQRLLVKSGGCVPQGEPL